MAFLTLRINKIKVIDVREFFGPGEVKLLSFVTSEDTPFPIVEKYFQENDEEEKKKIIKSAARQVVSSKELMTIENIKDGHEMIFGDTGYSLWTANKIVNSFNWHMVLIECDKDVRDIGSTILGYIEDPKFDSFISNVVQLAAFQMNPSVTLAIQVGKYVVERIGRELLKNKDDQIGVVYQSFYKELDYPGLDRRASNIPDISGNIRIDYRIWGAE